MRSPSLVLGLAMALAAGAAQAQTQLQGQPDRGPLTPIPEKIEPQQSLDGMGLPEPCRAAAEAALGQAMPMDHGTPQPMGDRVAQLSDTQRGLMQAMMKMQGAMMQGMAAKDADVAWVCSMIPHHQGAIDMARAGLREADNAESRKLAEETIRMQQAEIAKLTRWVEQNAAREGRK